MNDVETKPVIEEEEQDEEKKFTWTKDKIVLAVIFVALLLISIGLLIAMAVKQDLLFNIVRNYFIAPILSLHIALRVLIFLGLMIVQSLLVPIPSELILLSGGIIFGVYWGSAIGLVGSMLSATVTYYISKRGARAIVEASGEKVGLIKRTIYIFDEWIKSWGLWAILVGRAIPVIMFDPISYAAGLVKLKDWHYFLATFIGSIPRAIVYAFLGVKLLDGRPPDTILDLSVDEIEVVSKEFNIYFFIIFGILIFMFILSNAIYYIKKWKERKEAEEEQTDKTIDENDETELKEIQSELKEIKDEPIEIEPTSSDGPQFKEPEPEDIEEIDVEEDDEEEERFGDTFE